MHHLSRTKTNFTQIRTLASLGCEFILLHHHLLRDEGLKRLRVKLPGIDPNEMSQLLDPHLFRIKSLRSRPERQDCYTFDVLSVQNPIL